MDFIKKNAIAVFWVILLLHCVFIYSGLDDWRFITKLLLLPVLAVYLWAATKHNGGSVSSLVYFGLLFSFLGDLILTQPGETFFLSGMLAFIGTHICNGINFYKMQRGSMRGGRAVLLATIILLLITIGVLIILNPYLGQFQLPILVYMIIISSMAILATNTVNASLLKKIALQCFIPGAALFVFSDGILAMNKFLYHQPMLDIAVMLTYGAAQYFLISGFTRTAALKYRE